MYYFILYKAIPKFYSNNVNWINYYNLNDKDEWTIYNYSFYWACMTMITVGYGGIEIIIIRFNTEK